MISVSSRERAFHFTQHPLSSGSQRRQIVLYRVPQQLIVHAVITVADLVPHAGDQVPRNLRIALFEFFRQAFDRFAENLHHALECQRLAPIGFDLLRRFACAKSLSMLYILVDLAEGDAMITFAHTPAPPRAALCPGSICLATSAC